MDRLIAPNTVPFGSHDTQPTTGTPGMATDGNPGLGVPATIWPSYAWNMIEEEIRNAIIAGGGTPDGTNWAQLAAAIKNLATGRYLGLQGFGSPGTFTYTPTAGTRFIELEMLGAGGGGGGAVATGAGQYSTGGGGGSGAYLYKLIRNPASVSFVVGAAGQGNTGGSGGNGGTTSFAGIYTAAGGIGGLVGGPSVNFTVNPGGGGPGGGTGDIESGGNAGTSGLSLGVTVIGGNGGTPALLSGLGYGSAGQAGGSAIGPSAGGGGASRGPNMGAVAGGNGGSGYVRIREFG